ncbi:MAG: hypothetical protein NZ922_01290 [Candidatus Methanomethyliaceae archaeon]|nr:hypothetical protein [Candidatus Methanomethyliaceae archaeon]MDW7970393.1 30S ribosomal protein S24e [Nitrososphaerota archaeon]
MSIEESQISIIEDKYNPLIERRELTLEVTSKTTPKRVELRKALATIFKVPLDCIYVRSCITSFGTNRSICRIHIYKDAERARQIEPKYIQLRNSEEQSKK